MRISPHAGAACGVVVSADLLPSPQPCGDGVLSDRTPSPKLPVRRALYNNSPLSSPLLPRRSRAVAYSKAFAFVAVALLTSAYALLAEACKRRYAVRAGGNGGNAPFGFSPVALLLSAELVKLLLSLAALSLEAAPAPRVAFAAVARASLPALCYSVQNALQFSAMARLSPALYTLLANLKIVATAALGFLLLSRSQSRSSLAALSFLLLGCAIPGCAAVAREERSASSASQAASNSGPLVGVAIMVAVAVCSGAAAVATEAVLKQPVGSASFHNALLYACGCAFYLPPLLVAARLHGCSLGAPPFAVLQSFRNFFFDGWDGLAIALLAVLSLNGLAVAALVRRTDSDVKLFAGGAASVVCAAASAALLGTPLRAVDVLGGCVVVAALVIFRASAAVADAPQPPHKHAAPAAGGEGEAASV